MKIDARAAGGAATLLLLVSCASNADRQQSQQQRQLTQAMASPARSGPPEHIPEVARALLRVRMMSHAKDMSDLMAAVAILRYPEAEALASALVDDASLARPISGDASELNTLLPARFFDLQDNLRADARAVRDAARRQDALALGTAYGRLAQGCVGCHAMFRPAAPAPGMPAPGGTR